jgi:AP-3 complex subunit beta
MVLTSAIIAFSELCPERLELLHNPFRKICHLLTDMDEWGQVVVLDLMARYCRKFFKKPQAWKDGTAEQIDRERRVRRTLSGIASLDNDNVIDTTILTTTESNNGGAASTTTSASTSPKKIKRRVVKKGFYSDEEDESTEEEVDTRPPLAALRQPNLLQGGPPGRAGIPAITTNPQNAGDEDLDLDDDHRLMLRSSLPLLKSRNAAVVMAVCSLHYYCGVSSVKIRSAMGKALVRIHRDRREIQYVVLTSIQTLVQQCPSAFGPFLNDFFVKVSKMKGWLPA